MRRCALLLVLALAAGAVASCGPPPLNGSSSHELDRKHCGANADCSSGICRNGLCG